MTPRQIRRAAERKANKDARIAQNITPSEIQGTFLDLDTDLEFAATVPLAAISEAQLTANRQNAKSSTGPITPEGKSISSQNHRTHGLTGKFQLLPWEDTAEFQDLLQSLLNEHQPTTDSESRLVTSMLQHYWLMQRAIHLQNDLLLAADLADKALDEKRFSLYLRYQTTNERSYYKAIRELATLRKEQRQQQNGFESQKRQQELNDAKIRLANARAYATEVETEIKTTMEAPLPGHTRVPFEDLTSAFRVTLRNLNREFTANLAEKAAA